LVLRCSWRAPVWSWSIFALVLGGPGVVLYWSCGGLVVATRKGCPPLRENRTTMLEEPPRSPGEQDHLLPSPKGINIISHKGGFDGPTINHMVLGGPGVVLAGFRVVLVDNSYGPGWSWSGPGGVPCGPGRYSYGPGWSWHGPVWSWVVLAWSCGGPAVVLRCSCGSPGMLLAEFRAGTALAPYLFASAIVGIRSPTGRLS
jgi:hypothetical protein